MNEIENIPQPQNQSPRPRRRRRKPPKPPIKQLAICAAVIFGLGFLMGFLVRGAFIPKQEEPIQTESTEPSETSGAATEPTVSISRDDWRLTLVNPWNTIAEDFQVELAQIPNERYIDKRCYDDLMAMLGAMEAEGLSYVIRSGYRTMNDQQVLYQNKIDQLMDEGMSEEEATKEAGTIVAVPGTSEHQLGLAVDIVDSSYWGLDEKQEDTAVQKWLMENCWDYGFILRYPNDKSEITGIIYEPWHYRYVGKEVAKDMQEKGLCLEEYLTSSAFPAAAN